MMVRSVNENDFDRRFPKGFGRSQTTKTSAYDHHLWRAQALRIRVPSRDVIIVAHVQMCFHLFLKLLRAEISENLGLFRSYLGKGGSAR